jgi:hypothetical protein
MNLVARYDVACPNGHTTSLLEKNLRQIVAYLQWLDRAAPQITFVCWHCKTAFDFDYLNREPAEEIEDPPHSSEPFVCIVEKKCGSTHCGFPAELVAVRNRDTSSEEFQERFHQEVAEWPPMFCKKDHSVPSAVIPGSIRQL